MVDLVMKKGDIVFFHPLTVHGSGPNKTDGYRKSMCCHFAASECKYVPIENAMQKMVTEEVLNYVRKKVKSGKNMPFSEDVNYQSIWKFKAVLVAGE